jgi:hypothetical protein
VGLTTFDERAAVVSVATLNLASGTGWVTVVGTTELTRRVDALLFASTAPIAHDVLIALQYAGDYALVGTVTIPPGAGYTTVPLVDAVPLVAPANLAGWVLPTLYALKVKLAVILGAAEEITVSSLGGSI